MADVARPTARSSVFYLALLWLIGGQLRLTILAVPPVLPLIHRDLALSEKAIGVLSALPVLLLALAAVPGSLMVARLGARRGCILGLAIVAIAGAARGLGPSMPVLYGMTFAMGIGVALMQPTVPTLVGEWFPANPGFATATYANGLVLLGEAAPAALTIPLVLPLVGGSWGWSFAFWSVPVAVTALLVATTTSHRPRAWAARDYRWWPDWRGALPLGLLLGGTGGMYFSANAFIPDYLHALGRPELVTPALAALNAGQVPASIVIMLFARKLTGNRTVFIVSPLVALAGIAAFLSPLPEITVGAAGLVGFCAGMQLTLSLALPPHLATTDDVHHLSAGMFAVGYFVSFLIPPLGGAIWDATHVPASAFLAAGLSTVLVVAAALTMRSLRTAPAGSTHRR
ncbi:MAG TPA: MFS transporter [Stellaceae bacterium]|nr:MFS transporter [Stellaceae bacterium]